MECCEVTELLSAYHDRELPTDKAAAVADHIAACPKCAAALHSIERLSSLASQLDHPSPSNRVWRRIEAQLDSGTATVTTKRRTPRKAVIAAAVLTLLITSWAVFTYWHNREHERLAVNFGHFLDTFQRAPDEAQRELAKDYSGVPVQISDAIRELKYRPIVADGLPQDYEPGQSYLLKMPCCRCLEACYQRKDGGMLCIFEHDEDQPVWFGNRPTSSMMCSGHPTRIVQLQGSLAATWQQEHRHITLVGAKDVAEVSELITHFVAHDKTQ